MQIPKLQVLIEAGVVRDIEVNHDDTVHGWTVRITYASRAGAARSWSASAAGRGSSPPWMRSPAAWLDWA